MSRLCSSVSFLLILLGVVFGGGSTAQAQSEIRMIVNGMPITSFDIANRVRLMEISRQGGGTKQAIEDLINEAVQVTELRSRGGSVSQAQVDSAYANIASGMKLSAASLTSELAKAGVDVSTLKNRLRAQIGWSMLMQAKLRAEAKKNQDDVIAAIQSGKHESALIVKEYILQQIIFIVPKGSSAAFTAQRRSEAEAFRSRFKGCDTSVDQAKQLRNVVVREVGRRDTTQIKGPMADLIKNVSAGKASAPVPGDQGIDLFAVCSVREVRSTQAAESVLETKMALAKGEEIGKEYLKELRDKAIIQKR